LNNPRHGFSSGYTRKNQGTVFLVAQSKVQFF